jgi:excisionase family DNA binding protein
MEAEKYYTIKEAADLTTFSTNTIRKWIKQGLLKSEKVEGSFGQEYRIRAHDLYHSGIEKLNRRLGPDMVEVRRVEAQASMLESSEKYLTELTRLSSELIDARTELGVLRFQVPMLEAAQVERDSLREERDRLAQERAGLEAALNEARADMKWSARRRMSKAGKVQSG